MNLKYTSPIEEMQEILLYIENSKVLGKWRSFVNALKEAGKKFQFLLPERKTFIMITVI